MSELPLAEAALEGLAEESVIMGSELGQPGPRDDDGPIGEAGEGGERGEPGGPGGSGEERSTERPPPRPASRALAVTIVFATLVAALSGFLLNRASVASSDAGDTAQVLSLRGSAAQTSALEQAESDYNQYLSVQALQSQASEEMFEAASDPADAQLWARLYASTEAQVNVASKSLPSDMRPNLPNGEPDTSFPYDFYAHRSSEGTYLDAQSNSYNDVSGQWSRLADKYTVLLTIVAVALFLFGSAYVLYGRNRLLFYSLGTALVALSVVWGLTLALVRQPGVPSPAAAKDYANGVLALASAQGPAQVQPAISAFTAAIKARPDFSLAYSERATAEVERGSEQLGGGFISNVAPYWLKRAAGDELKAYELGDHDANQLLNVGFTSYQLWVLNGGHGSPPGLAVSFFRQAADLDPSNPVPLLDYALAELADRNYPGARQAYIASLTHMLFTCSDPSVLATCTTKQPPTSYTLQRAWFSGVMETLVTLSTTADAASSPALRSEIVAIRGMVSQSMAEGKFISGPSSPGFAVKSAVGFIDPNFLGFDVTVPTGETPAEMAATPMSIVWYQRQGSSSKWSAIPEATCWGVFSRCSYYYQAGNDFQFVTQFLAAANTCFTNVDYRVELYVRGTLVRTLALTPANDYITTNLKAALAKTMNIGICVPSGWHIQTPLHLTLKVYGTSEVVSGPLTGSEMGYTSADGREGAYVFRLYAPSAAGSGPKALVSLVRSVGNYAVSALKGRGLPSDLSAVAPFSPDGVWGGQVKDMQSTAYLSRSTGEEAFVGAAQVAVLSGTTPAQNDNDIARYIESDHAIVVTIIYGPRRSGLWSGRPSLGVQIFGSWSLLNYG